MPKLKWQVSSAPTGRYRSFERRGWPMAYAGDKVIAHMTCEDDYVPKKVREGTHKPIKVRVAQYSDTDQERGGRGFKWRTLKQESATLDDAKKLAQYFFDNHPAFFEGPQ